MPCARLCTLLASLAIVVVAGCGEDSGTGSEQQTKDSGNGGEVERDTGPFKASSIDAECPGALLVGVPVELRLRVKNTGTDDWPVTFVTFPKGLDHFTVDNARMGPLVGRKADTPAFDTYRFGTGAGLRVGQERTAIFELTPNDPGNFELKFAAWGGKEDERSVPDYEGYSCDVSIDSL